MRNFKAVVSIMMLLIITSSCTLPQKREIIEKSYPIQSFSSVEADIVGNIIYTQSSKTSVRVEGDKNLVDRLLVAADNEVLKLYYYEKKQKNISKKKLTIYITSPAIEKINMDGVGNFVLEGLIAAENLTIDFEGVGNFKAMQLQSNSIDASYEGVGNLELGGTTDFLELSSKGVGSVDTQKLEAKNAIVRAEGVGSVKCYASESIDLNNRGVGGITYYGNPVVTNLNKSDIGKIKAGK